MNDNSLNERVTELENHVVRNERTLEELSEVVRRNGDELATLKAEIAVLGREILQLTEGEREPHIKPGA
jgi:uncharacterized coiled-coil protein SlyX